MSGKYFAWSGFGAIEEVDFEDFVESAENEAIEFFHKWVHEWSKLAKAVADEQRASNKFLTLASQDRTWTLWFYDHATGRPARLVAYVLAHGENSVAWLTNPRDLENDMGQRRFQHPGGGPRDPNELYQVRQGDVHKAVCNILNEHGLNEVEALRSVIQQAAVAKVSDHKIREFLDQLMAELVSGARNLAVSSTQRVSLKDIILERVREEVHRIVVNGLRIDVGLAYPPRPTDGPIRRIRTQGDNSEQAQPGA